MSDSHVAVSGVPVKVLVPVTGATSAVTLFNEGTSPLYVGQDGVTQGNGLSLLPGQEVSLPSVTVALYACSGAAAGSVSTTTTAALNAGGSSVTLTSGTGFAAGDQVIVGSGGAAEVVTLTAISGGTASTTAVNYDHKSGAAFALAVPAGSSLHVTPGAV